MGQYDSSYGPMKYQNQHLKCANRRQSLPSTRLPLLILQKSSHTRTQYIYRYQTVVLSLCAWQCNSEMFK